MATNTMVMCMHTLTPLSLSLILMTMQQQQYASMKTRFGPSNLTSTCTSTVSPPLPTCPPCWGLTFGMCLPTQAYFHRLLPMAKCVMHALSPTTGNPGLYMHTSTRSRAINRIEYTRKCQHRWCPFRTQMACITPLSQGALQGQGLSVDIPDIGGGASVLYILHGGIQPSLPVVGHFAYKISTTSFKLCHPEGLPSILDFTGGGIPFWCPTLDLQERLPCNFMTIQSLLTHFQNTFDPREFNVHVLPMAFSVTSEELNNTDSSGALRMDGVDVSCSAFRPPKSLEESGAWKLHVLKQGKCSRSPVGEESRVLATGGPDVVGTCTEGTGMRAQGGGHARQSIALRGTSTMDENGGRETPEGLLGSRKYHVDGESETEEHGPGDPTDPRKVKCCFSTITWLSEALKAPCDQNDLESANRGAEAPGDGQMVTEYVETVQGHIQQEFWLTERNQNQNHRKQGNCFFDSVRRDVKGNVDPLHPISFLATFQCTSISQDKEGYVASKCCKVSEVPGMVANRTFSEKWVQSGNLGNGEEVVWRLEGVWKYEEQVWEQWGMIADTRDCIEQRTDNGSMRKTHENLPDYYRTIHRLYEKREQALTNSGLDGWMDIGHNGRSPKAGIST
ncbi:hypothetical protein L210DRAFT_3503954 [Boletus edulis BED1]|uniref:Uncharacterized protein n=1 Tax=Boletus edulis BED1 TaxID=1328754 RepID=A0AAD4GEP8_BOLED|nr:hypothetical protein L210DRAFT_3503954 [Boletus edulis BED1]